MKKILSLLLIVSVFQGSLLLDAQPTQYKYLNRLSEDSELKRICESLEGDRGEFGKICDEWDASYDYYKQHLVQNEFDNKYKKQAQKYIEGCNQEGRKLFFQSSKWQGLKNAVKTYYSTEVSSKLEIAFPDSEAQKERIILLSLFDEICQETFDEFERDTIFCAKK